MSSVLRGGSSSLSLTDLRGGHLRDNNLGLTDLRFGFWGLTDLG